MAASSTAIVLRPPTPPKQAAAAGARRPQPQAPASVSMSSSHALRRACVAAAACAAVMGMAVGDTPLALARAGGAVVSRPDAAVVAAAPLPRWSERRGCPAWRANSLENVVPENLPRPSSTAHGRFDSFSVTADAPDLYLVAMRPGNGTGCFSL